ncbi:MULTISPECIES: hypothetical protein [Clostridium]|uniref:hypothetical protein n=1 Tax=Clostridium TaxID=1485 RepID=UPI00189C5414|nr:MULTISPECIES: hypothetical protein [Clostridium]MDI9218759.1 hypothetical protein [Clostridium tertium]
MSTFVLKREYNLQLPNNYVGVDREEMEYVDGGARYSGSQGWIVASALTAVGYGVAAFGKGTLTVFKAALSEILLAGPLAWLISAVCYITAASLTYMGGTFAGAGSEACWYMGTKGYFDLTFGTNPFALLSVS